MARQKLVLAVLVVIMGLVYVRALRHPGGRLALPQPASSEPSASARPSAAVRQDITRERAAQRRRTETLSWERDPFLRGGTEGTSGLVLSGILWDANAPIAILNGQMLHVGDELEGYRIVYITPDHVAVTDGTDTLQLQIAP